MVSSDSRTNASGVREFHPPAGPVRRGTGSAGLRQAGGRWGGPDDNPASSPSRGRSRSPRRHPHDSVVATRISQAHILGHAPGDATDNPPPRQQADPSPPDVEVRRQVTQRSDRRPQPALHAARVGDTDQAQRHLYISPSCMPRSLAVTAVRGRQVSATPPSEHG